MYVYLLYIVSFISFDIYDIVYFGQYITITFDNTLNICIYIHIHDHTYIYIYIYTSYFVQTFTYGIYSICVFTHVTHNLYMLCM